MGVQALVYVGVFLRRASKGHTDPCSCARFKGAEIYYQRGGPLLGQCHHYSSALYESQVSPKRFLGFLSGWLQRS